MATLSGKASLQQCREATVLSLCVATLPPHYGYAVLKGTIGNELWFSSFLNRKSRFTKMHN